MRVLDKGIQVSRYDARTLENGCCGCPVGFGTDVEVQEIDFDPTETVPNVGR